MIDRKIRIRAIFLFLLLVLLFLLSLKGLILSYYPRSGKKILSVSIELKGAWQDQIENLITNPVEEELLRMEGIRRLVSRSEDEKALITLFLDDRTDLDHSYLQLRDILDRIPFPERAQKPQISKNDSNDLPVFIIEMKNSLSEEEVKSMLKQVDGVGQIDLSGNPKKDVFIPVSQDDLRDLKLSVRNIAGLLGKANVIGSVPLASAGQTSLLLDFRFREPEDFEGQFLNEGLSVGTLGKAGFAITEQKSHSRVNGEDATIAWIKEAGDANTIKLCRDLRNISTRLGETRIIYDKGMLIEDALKEILSVLIMSLLSVILVTFLILREFKSSILLCLNIPFSLCGTLAVFRILGWDVDILVLAGLALATGMIIDSGVIYMETGKKTGMRPILFSLLSTLLVFSSFVFASYEVRIQSEGLIKSLCISLSLSVFYILFIMHGFVQRQEPASLTLKRTWMNRVFTGIQRFRILTFLSILLCAAAGIFLTADLEMTREFQLPDPSLRFSLEFPSGYGLNRVISQTRSLENEMKEWEETTFFTSEYKDEKASYHIHLGDEKAREVLKKRISRILYGSVGYLHFRDWENTKEETVRLRAQERALLYGTAEDLASELQKATGKGIVLHFKKQPLQYVLTPRPDSLGASQIFPGELAVILDEQLNRPVLGKWFPPPGAGMDQTVYDLRIADPSIRKKSWDDLINTPLAGGETLGSLTNIREEANYGAIIHEEGMRSISFSLPDTEITPAVEKILNDGSRTEGVRIDYGEEKEELAAYTIGLIKTLCISLVLLMLLLLYLYESLFLPLYLFVQILLCHLFSLAVLKIAGFPLSSPVFFALILNTGLLINNGLMIFGKYSGRRPGYGEVISSVRECSISLITAAVTTLGGLIPLLFRSSGSGGMLPALSLTVGTGIIFSLILQLVTIPLVFKEQGQSASVSSISRPGRSGM